MTLADSINLPIVAALGLATFGPLTLLVTAVEALVFRVHLKTGFRAVFKRVLFANIISTLAGALLMMFQDVVVQAAEIRESIPAFVRGYRWVAPLLIAAYFTKSVLVEGLWLTRRRFLKRIERQAGRTLRTVLLANMCSYLVVGPLFYISTRPHFGGLETSFDTRWTANPDLVVYYIDRDDWFVKQVRLGSEAVETLVPFPTSAFVVSEDESTFAYVGANCNLYAYRAGESEPILVRERDNRRFMTTISLSPDNRRLAYVDPPIGEDRPYKDGNEESLKTLDLETREVVEIGKLPARDWGPPIAWSARGEAIYALRVDRSYDVERGRVTSEERTIYVFNAEPPFGLREQRTTPPTQSELVVNYGRVRGNSAYARGRPLIQSRHRFRAGGYDVEVWPYLGGGLRVEREKKKVLLLQNEYGLLNLSLPPIQSATFLSSGDELLLEWWGQSYLLSLASRRLSLAANGEQFVLRSPEFRVSFRPDTE